MLDIFEGNEVNETGNLSEDEELNEAELQEQEVFVEQSKIM